MALVDLLDRSIVLRFGGRTFEVRPVTVLGMLEAQSILSTVAASEREAPRIDALKAAVADGDEAAATRSLAEYYLDAFDALGRERTCAILALVSTPADAGMIALTLDDPTALPAWLGAIGELHDIPRLLTRFAQTASHGAPVPDYVSDSDDIGLDTVLVDLAMALPQYTIEDLLRWPYERFLTVLEQVRSVRSLRAGQPSQAHLRMSHPMEIQSAGVGQVQVRPTNKTTAEIH